MDQMMKRADYITIHIPKTPETTGMISTVHLNLAALSAKGEIKVTDLITGQKFVWGEHNYVRLDSFTEPAHILRVES
jgi:starch synthase (maltosyl-transferring)